MPKSADTSKTIRLKSSIVALIEQEAKRRGVSFLDTVYFIILHYFMQNNQSAVQTSFTESTMITNSSEEEEEEEEIEEMSAEDKPDFSNMKDFE